MFNLLEKYKKGKITDFELEFRMILEGCKGNLFEKVSCLNEAEILKLKYITKTYPVTLSKYDNIHFSCWIIANSTAEETDIFGISNREKFYIGTNNWNKFFKENNYGT